MNDETVYRVKITTLGPDYYNNYYWTVTNVHDRCDQATGMSMTLRAARRRARRAVRALCAGQGKRTVDDYEVWCP